MIPNYGVILRQIRNGKGVLCYTAFFLVSQNEQDSWMHLMTWHSHS